MAIDHAKMVRWLRLRYITKWVPELKGRRSTWTAQRIEDNSWLDCK